MPKTTKGRVVNRLNLWRLRRQGVQTANNTVIANCSFLGPALIEPYCRIYGIPEISIGADFYMNVGGQLLGDIHIGRQVLLGPRVIMWSRDHGRAPGVPIKEQDHVNQPIRIGDDVWVGAGAIILKGVNIGSGAVVGAGAVVTKNVAPSVIVAGNPAKEINRR